MPYTLNLYSAVGQSRLDKTGKAGNNMLLHEDV